VSNRRREALRGLAMVLAPVAVLAKVREGDEDVEKGKEGS